MFFCAADADPMPGLSGMPLRIRYPVSYAIRRQARQPAPSTARFRRQAGASDQRIRHQHWMVARHRFVIACKRTAATRLSLSCINCRRAFSADDAGFDVRSCDHHDGEHAISRVADLSRLSNRACLAGGYPGKPQAQPAVTLCRLPASRNCVEVFRTCRQPVSPVPSSGRHKALRLAASGLTSGRRRCSSASVDQVERRMLFQRPSGCLSDTARAVVSENCGTRPYM